MDIKILSGNELLIQGGLEAGISLYTGYPGSPLADYFNILHRRRKEFKKKKIKVVIANSEANAGAMASGAKMAGRDTMVAMKSMGLHVAADAFSVGNFANPGPKIKDPETGELISSGVVVVVGDDPWSISTSTPADSRYLFKHLHMPFLMPSNPQELKDWIQKALEVSKRSSVYCGLLLTTEMAEGGGRVQVGVEKNPAEYGPHELDPSQFNLQENVMVPPNSLMADKTMIEVRFPKIEKILKDLDLDRLYPIANDGEESPFPGLGIISGGNIFESVKEVMEKNSLIGKIPLYKLASPYPLVKDNLLPFLKGLKNLIVIEEKRGFIEGELATAMLSWGVSLNLLGKHFRQGKEGFSAHGGLSYEIIESKLLGLLKEIGPELPSCQLLKEEVRSYDAINLPRRLPTFCPGCPHRETLSLLKEIRSILAAEDIQLVSHGDVGCYSLSFLPPFREMHDLSAMGQGGALGAGTDIFVDNPSVVLMGDSTFFHSGMSAISNSEQMGHNITYILLDNDNTAMTGHQMTPVSGVSVEGLPRPRQDMLKVVEGMNVDRIQKVNPSDRYFYKNLLLDTVRAPGVKVIVSDKECGLTFHGRRKKKERKLLAESGELSVKTFFQINTEACEDCRECVEMTGCPGLAQTFDAYGTKVSIDPSICVSDSYCTKIKACPSFEKVDVFNYHPVMGDLSSTLAEAKHNLPRPKAEKTFEDIAAGDELRMVVIGVGGSGVTTIGRVLAEACLGMGGRTDLDFKFFDQKGLAQRNGSVTGHLSIGPSSKSLGTITPLGRANRVLSPDLLEGARAISFLEEGGLFLSDQEYQIPLTQLLDREEDAKAQKASDFKKELENRLGDRASFYSFKEISQEIFGRPVYSSTMLLGALFQQGGLPFSLSDMETALGRAIPKAELENNLMSFTVGRFVALQGEDKFWSLVNRTPPGLKDLDPSAKLWKKSLQESFLFPFLHAAPVLEAFNSKLIQLKEQFPHIKESYLGTYLHDIYLFDRGQKVEEFMAGALKIKSLYQDKDLQELALRVLAKTFFLKDEVFVAHQLVSPIRAERDRQQYSALGKSYKVTHINRPSFDLMGKTLEFDINPKDWMLKLMRHMRFFRRLMPAWHKKEREIASTLRTKVLSSCPDDMDVYTYLKKLENVKGYREIRFKSFEQRVS